MVRACALVSAVSLPQWSLQSLAVQDVHSAEPLRRLTSQAQHRGGMNHSDLVVTMQLVVNCLVSHCNLGNVLVANPQCHVCTHT